MSIYCILIPSSCATIQPDPSSVHLLRRPLVLLSVSVIETIYYTVQGFRFWDLLLLYPTTTKTCAKCVNVSNIYHVYCSRPQNDLITTVHGWATAWANAITAFSTASSSLCHFWHLSYLAVSSHTLLCVSIIALPKVIGVTQKLFSVLSCCQKPLCFFVFFLDVSFSFSRFSSR